jgi:hypothetical protein
MPGESQIDFSDSAQVNDEQGYKTDMLCLRTMSCIINNMPI